MQYIHQLRRTEWRLTCTETAPTLALKKKRKTSLTFSLFHGNSRHCIPEVHVGCSLNKSSVLERWTLTLNLHRLSSVSCHLPLSLCFVGLSMSHTHTHLSFSVSCTDTHTKLWESRIECTNLPPLPQRPHCSLVHWVPLVRTASTHTHTHSIQSTYTLMSRHVSTQLFSNLHAHIWNSEIQNDLPSHACLI